jgi:hypothetical protein
MQGDSSAAQRAHICAPAAHTTSDSSGRGTTDRSQPQASSSPDNDSESFKSALWPTFLDSPAPAAATASAAQARTAPFVPREATANTHVIGSPRASGLRPRGLDGLDCPSGIGLPTGFVRSRSPADHISREAGTEEVGGTDSRKSARPLLERALATGYCPKPGQGGQHLRDMLETKPEELKPHRSETLLFSRFLWAAPWLL